MRGDRVGVGDIDAVLAAECVAWVSANADDVVGAWQQHDTKLVSGCGWREPGWAGQPGMYWIGVSDGAWGKHGTCVVFGLSQVWADGMRDD